MKQRTQNPTGCKEENLIKNRERSKTICSLGLIFAFILLGIIIVTTMALAKYVIKDEKDIEVTLRNVRISENEIEIIPSSWTNENVTVSISTKKNGEVYYKINENGEWKKYEKNFEVEENCNIYTKIKYTDGESPETVKEVTNIDKIKPTVEIQDKSEYTTSNIVTKLDGIENTNNGHSTSTTTWNDISGNKKNGTITDGTWGENYLQFNGTTTWANLGVMNSNYQTLEATFSADRDNIAEDVILSNWENGGAGIYLANGRLHASFYIGGAYKVIPSKEKCVIGEIYNAIGTYDGKKLSFYVNGVLQGELSITGTIGTPANSTVMAIGVNPSRNGKGGSTLFKGKIYNVAIYNQALTADQVRSNAQNSLAQATGKYTILAGETTININKKLIAKDEGGSGLKTLSYAYSQSNTTEPTTYEEFKNEATVKKSATGGNWYIWTKVLDNAGNRAEETKISPAYNVGYQISYDANGGTGAPKEQRKVHGTELKISEIIPTRTGYEFQGWATANTATTAELKDGENYTTDKAITLYAVWKKYKYLNTTTSKYYMKLSDALNEVKDKETIKAMDYAIETTAPTLAAAKAITFDLNGQTIVMSNVTLTNNGTLTITGASGTLTGSGADTITNNGTFVKNTETELASSATTDYYVVKNNGTATIGAGKLNGSFRIIRNNGNGILNITGGNFTSKNGIGILNYDNGNISISGGVIEGKEDTIGSIGSGGNIKISGGSITASEKAGVSICAGTTANITGGNITGRLYGIWSNSDINITIGKNDGNVSIESPKISSNYYGIFMQSGKINFYDGAITGASGKSIGGTAEKTVEETATNCVVVKTTSGSTETAVLGPSAPVITAKLNNSSGANYTAGTWTNQNVWVQLKSASIGAGIKAYQWYENGAWTTRDLTTSSNIGTITYTVTRNEAIRFRAIDNNGVISYETVLGIKIDKIAPTAPTIEKSYGILPNCSHSVTNLTVSGSTYTATSNDPTISFSGVNKYTNVTGVRVKFNKALEKDLQTLQVFYSTGGAGYSEANSKKVGAPAGSTEVKVDIPKGTYDNIRVDIGSVSGVSFELNDIYLITSDDIWNNGNIRLVLNSTDANSGIANYQIKYSGSSNSWKDISTTTDAWSAERNETIYYRAVDKAGNASEGSSIPIKIDRTAPTAPTITNSSGGNWTNQDVKITLSSTDSQSGVLKYQYKYSGTNNQWTDTKSTDTWSGGRNETIYYRAVDNAGNISKESSTAIKIDKTAPTISSVTPSNAWDYSNNVTINATDNNAISAYAVTTTNTAPTEWIETTNIDLSNVQTKRENGASWARVFYHNNRGGSTLFANETEAKSVDTAYKYSALGTLDNYKDSTGNWEFMLQYPRDISGKYNRWKQTANPVTTTVANGTGSETAPGYSAVHIDWNQNYWGGLTKSTASQTFINGSVGYAWWQYAIGAYQAWNGGIPGPSNPVFQGTELWARIDTLTKANKKTLTAKVGNLTTNGTYYVWVKDHLGNVSSKAVTTNKVDTTAPTAPTITNSSGGNWTNKNVTITLSSTDSQSGVLKYQCKYSGTSNRWADAKSTDTWSAARNETIYYRSIDNAGNVSAVSSTAIKIDKTAPAAPTITNSSGGNWTNQSVTTKVTSTDAMSGIAKYQIKYSGTSNTWRDFDNNNSSHTSWAADRNETLYFRAIDNAGNISAESSTLIKIDKTAPTITSAEIKNVTPTGYDVYVYGVKDAGSGVNRVQFPTWTSANGQDDIQSDWVNSTAATGTKQSDGTTWVYRVNTKAHKNESGTYYTHIYVYDNLGNSKNVSTHTITVPSVTVTYDNNYLAGDLATNSVLVGSYAYATTSTKTKTTTENLSAKYGREVQFTMNAGTSGGPYLSCTRLTVGETYTWSVYLKASRNITLATTGQEQGGRKLVNVSTSWQRMTYTFKANDNSYNAFVFYDPSGGWKDGDILYIHSLEIAKTSSLNTTTATKSYGNTLSTLPTPTRTGYTFAGWYTAPTGGTKIATTTAVPSSNTTYYAHWTVNKYYLDLNGNCDSSSVGKINDYGTANVDINGVNDSAGVTDYYKQWPYGTQYAINNIKATTGHTYNGVASGSLTGTITGTTSVSLKFTTNKYNLTFQNVYNTFEVKILSSAGALKRTVNISSSSPTISNILYTDIIETSTTGVKQTVSGTAFTEVKCSNVPTRTGYTWNSSVKYTMGAENTKAYRWNGTGWYTDHNGDTQCTAFSRLASTNGYTAKLTIGWTVNNYTVTYNYGTNGGTSATKTTASVAYGSNVDLTPTATKSGWTFVGWNTSSTATKKLSSLAMGTSNVTLYAIYSKTLTGTFKYYNNQTKTVPTTIYNTATKGAITAPAALGTPSGYTFRHWSTATAANAAKTVAASGSITISANTTYYASYQQTVTATFYYHPGTDQYAISQSSTTAPGTRYMGYTGGIVNGSITIPTAVSGSTGIYGTKYAGVSTSTNSLTAASVTTANTKYYAYYDVGVTYYYWNGSKVTASNPSSTRRRALSNGSNYVLSATNVPSTTSAYDSASFKNWTYDLNAIYERTPTSTASTTLYAYYQKSVTATFWYYNNGAASKTASGTKSYITNTSSMKTVNGNITVPKEVSANKTLDRTYTYNGVSTSSAANATNVTPTTANTTYYANYRYSIKVTFDSNGATSGKSDPKPITGNVYCSYTMSSRTGLSVKMPDNTEEYALVKSGANASYTFSGWNSKTDGTGTAYSANTSYTFYDSTTVYVRWFRPVYKNTTTNKTYDILCYAFMEANTGEVIQMQQNSNTEPLEGGVASGKTIYLELNGKTLTTKESIRNNGILYVNHKGSTSGTINYTGTKVAVLSVSSSITSLQMKNATITSNGMGIQTTVNAIILSKVKVTSKKEGIKISAKDNVSTIESCTVNATYSGVQVVDGRAIITSSNITGDYGVFNFDGYIQIENNSIIKGTTYAGIINWSENAGTTHVGTRTATFSTTSEQVTGKTYGVQNTGSKSYMYLDNGRVQGLQGATNGALTTTRSGYTIYTTTSGSYKVIYLKAASRAKALSKIATMRLGRNRAISIVKDQSNSVDDKNSKEEDKQSGENKIDNSNQSTDENEHREENAEEDTEKNKEENSSEKITEKGNNIGEYNKEQMDNAKMNAKDVDDYEKEYILLRYEENKYSNNPEELKKKMDTEDIENKTLWIDQTENKLDAIMTNANWKDKYLEFNGETTYGTLDKINTKALTIETTISCIKLPEEDDECIIGDAQNNTELLYVTKEGNIKAKLKIGEKEYEATSIQKLEENKVYGITLTYDGKKLVIYINGKEDVRIEIEEGKKFFDNELKLIIGAKSNEKTEIGTDTNEDDNTENDENAISNYFYGNMYTFSIYNEAIDEEKILNNYIYNSKLIEQE